VCLTPRFASTTSARPRASVAGPPSSSAPRSPCTKSIERRRAGAFACVSGAARTTVCVIEVLRTALRRVKKFSAKLTSVDVEVHARVGSASARARVDEVPLPSQADSIEKVAPTGPRTPGSRRWHPQADWTAVCGLDDHVQALKESVALPLLYPEVFQRLGAWPLCADASIQPAGIRRRSAARSAAARPARHGQDAPGDCAIRDAAPRRC
jgi:hypothetical protein